AGDRAPLPFSPKPRFEVFTTLNTTYENALVHEAPIIPKPLLPPPRRPGSRPMPNTGVFCHFHQFGGHDTESCVALRNIIEGLIREGKLDKYVHNLPPPPNPHQRQINMISTISGGPTLAGTSNNSIKHYVRSTYTHQVFSAEQGRLPKTYKSGWAPITFCEEEERGVILPHDDPIIIRADISNFDVGSILVDTGSSVSVMFAEAFNELQVPSHLLDRSITPLVSFSGEVVQPIGSIHLPISIGAAPQRRTITTPFLIIDCPTAYNVILGRPAMAEMKDRHLPLTSLNSEVFAWSYNDMPDISPDIISHRLSISPAVRPVRQKHRAYDPERYEAMRAEVDKLSTIGFIKEDSFPLHPIDQLVDATAGHALLSFMDAYSGYNQIFKHPEDQAHTSFITDRGLYCYKVMPFGLKNAGATYQRLVNSIFAPLIGNTMEVYVDDMLVKSRTTDQHIPNLSAMFTILKRYKMRLNPTKCAFGVASGKFIGFMISQRAPLLSTPEPGDTLMIYLSVSATAVSSVLIQTKEGAEHYKMPRLVKWAIELGEFDIHYRPRPATKGQASNGQVDAVNKIIKRTLKTKLDKAKGCWPELLPEVLWSYRTTFRTSTGETPFSLSFGTEAVAPVEIGQPTYRTSTYEAEANDEQLALNLDFIDELRDQSNMRNVAYKQRIAKYYNSRVKPRAFTTGDWVMRKVSLATKNPNEGTLGPTWEGPYEITKVNHPGNYQLRDSKGKTLPHPWNADHLKYYFK
ncbi:unnamed protein product, partial [Prunus brigantina]